MKLLIRKNAVGMGHDIQNAAVISTRFKFKAHCRVLDSRPEDEYLTLLLEIPGIIEANVYDHAGLYDVHIKKATAFEWEEVEPKIMEILNFRHEMLEKAARE